MRYVNLKKRNTSKFQFVTKRLATASAICLFLTAVIVVPLTNKPNAVQAINNDIAIEATVDNEVIDTKAEITLDEINL